MQLTEQHQITPNDRRYGELDMLTRFSNNLYNSALYQWRQAFFNGVSLPGYADICFMFASGDQKDYRSLPAKVAQQTIKQTFWAIDSFFGLLYSENVDNERVEIPRYRNKGGRYTVLFTNQALSKPELKDGFVKLSGTEVKVKTMQKPTNVHQVKVIPHNGYITVEVVYETKEKPLKKDNGRHAALDPGACNLAAVGTNFGRGFLIRGGPMRSILQYRNKRGAELTRRLMDQRERELLKTVGIHGKAAVKQYRRDMKEERNELLREIAECRKEEEEGLSEEERKERKRKRRNKARRARQRSNMEARMRARQKVKKFTSRRKRALERKCRNKLTDYMHKASAMLVNRLVSTDVSVLFIGKNKNWKQEAGLMRAARQNFELMPIARFLDMVEYKCRLKGIRVVYVQESYTSKCSFLDGESIEHHDSYVGKRIRRGLFRSASGKVINADINGALNIMRKEIGDFQYPIEVCSTPVALAIKA